jgi:hypothetical protein
MRKFTVFVLSSLGALTLLGGTAAAGAAGLYMYSARHAEHDADAMRRVEFVEKQMGEMPGCFDSECLPADVVVPAPVPAAPTMADPTEAATPAPLDRDEELLALKAQLAAALQRIAELEAEATPEGATPETPAAKRAGGDF